MRRLPDSAGFLHEFQFEVELEMPRVGAERTDVSPLWPTNLVPAASSLIYLDLNHWIGLAKAHTGHGDGKRFRSALNLLRAARDGLSTSSACR